MFNIVSKDQMIEMRVVNDEYFFRQARAILDVIVQQYTEIWM